MKTLNSHHKGVDFVWCQTWPPGSVATAGGIPRRMSIDNAKCAITRECAQDPTVQRAYAECAKGYRFKIHLWPPHDPQKKGIVECGVSTLVSGQ